MLMLERTDEINRLIIDFARSLALAPTGGIAREQ